MNKFFFHKLPLSVLLLNIIKKNFYLNITNKKKLGQNFSQIIEEPISILHLKDKKKIIFTNLMKNIIKKKLLKKILNLRVNKSEKILIFCLNGLNLLPYINLKKRIYASFIAFPVTRWNLIKIIILNFFVLYRFKLLNFNYINQDGQDSMYFFFIGKKIK
ncbi:hypothetical protein OAR82_02305 [Candidatus Pelagibacter sp.]|nr:hypothetical protein [Candidatus Pelagibacter sp.]